MSRIASRLNYANVMATVAVFLALGGGAVAAVKLGKNAVKTKSIANGAVKTKKLANNAVTESKIANGAVTDAKVPNLVYQNVSGFTNGWGAPGGVPAPQFAKDVQGVVHLRGNTGGGTDNQAMFTLPPGFRPSGNLSTATTSGFSTECTIGVETNGEVTPTGCNNLFVSLDTITFSAGG